MRSIIPRAEEFAIPRVLRALGITTPVLAVKDFTLDSERVESLRHGCDATLPAPFDPDELCANIEALVRYRPQDYPQIDG